MLNKIDCSVRKVIRFITNEFTLLILAFNAGLLRLHLCSNLDDILDIVLTIVKIDSLLIAMITTAIVLQRFDYEKNSVNSEFYKDLYSLKETLIEYEYSKTLDNYDYIIKEKLKLRFELKQSEFETKYAVLLNKNSKHNKIYQDCYNDIINYI